MCTLDVEIRVIWVIGVVQYTLSESHGYSGSQVVSYRQMEKNSVMAKLGRQREPMESDGPMVKYFDDNGRSHFIDLYFLIIGLKWTDKQSHSIKIRRNPIERTTK